MGWTERSLALTAAVWAAGAVGVFAWRRLTDPKAAPTGGEAREDRLPAWMWAAGWPYLLLSSACVEGVMLALKAADPSRRTARPHPARAPAPLRGPAGSLEG